MLPINNEISIPSVPIEKTERERSESERWRRKRAAVEQRSLQRECVLR